jgi:hypothetical protein
MPAGAMLTRGTLRESALSLSLRPVPLPSLTHPVTSTAQSAYIAPQKALSSSKHDGTSMIRQLQPHVTGVANRHERDPPFGWYLHLLLWSQVHPSPCHRLPPQRLAPLSARRPRTAQSHLGSPCPPSGRSRFSQQGAQLLAPLSKDSPVSCPTTEGGDV